MYVDLLSTRRAHGRRSSRVPERSSSPCLQLKDGFIHLSTSKQLPGTLERFFSNSSQVGDQLYILALPRSPAVEAKLRFDAALDTSFGHIYGVRAMRSISSSAACPPLLTTACPLFFLHYSHSSLPPTSPTQRSSSETQRAGGSLLVNCNSNDMDT